MQNFEMIETKQVEKIVMNLDKKGTEEGISSELLKSIFYVIKELVEVINDSLRTGQCPDGWKTSSNYTNIESKQTKKGK